MLKLSKLSDYGTLLMSLMAREPQRVHSGFELAARSNLPAPTVAKLLKTLVRGGLLQSQRGARGGYQLVRAPELISVADVITALEGPIAVTECSSDHSSCALASDCGTRTNWQLINIAIRDALESISLAQMAAPSRALPEHEHLLTFHRPHSQPV